MLPIENLLGKPDDKTVNVDGVGIVTYTYYGKLDSGKKRPDSLRLYTIFYKGQNIIIAIYNPLTEKPEYMPWGRKAWDDALRDLAGATSK